MAGRHELSLDPHEFGGKRVLVTGGSKGIGQAVLARLGEGGATVLATARTEPTDLADTTLFVATDITTAEGRVAVVNAVHERPGGIDVIVHAVGGSSAPAGRFAVPDDGEWHRALDLNLFPAVRLDSALVPGHARPGLWRDHSYHFDPARGAPARSNYCLCCSEGCPGELQQGLSDIVTGWSTGPSRQRCVPCRQMGRGFTESLA